MQRRRTQLLVLSAVAALGVAWLLLHPPAGQTGLAGAARASDPPASGREPTTPRLRRQAAILPSAELSLVGLVVSGTSGRPVSDASVEFASGPRTRTDRHGRFAINGLAPGTYVVQATLADDASEPARIHLRPGADPVVLPLYAAARLSVTVRSSISDEPLRGARVQVRSGAFGEPLVRAGVSDDQGQVEFSGLSADSYVVVAAADGFEGVEQALPPRAGLRWSHDIALRPGAAIDGRVVDAFGRPIPGATVSALPAAQARRVPVTYQGAFDATSNADGDFRLPAVAAGAVSLRATHAGYLPGWSAEIAVDGHTARGGVVLALAEGASIEGQVVTESGAPVARATVRVGPRDSTILGGGTRTVTSDDAGRFRIAGLAATAMDVVASSDQASSETVHVDLAEPVPDLVLSLSLDQSISGIVTDPHDHPIAGATVVCVGAPAGAIGTRPVLPESTDAAGRFSCAGLPTGTYELTAMKPGSNNNTGPWQRSAGAVAEAGDDAVVIMIPDDGAVQGRVRTAHGAVPPSFGVELDVGGLPRIFAAGDGLFALDGLAPRTYQLVITAAGERASLAVAIPEGGTLDLGTIALQPVPATVSPARAFRPPAPR